MPRVSEEFGGGGFLKAEDLHGKMVSCSIAGFEKREFPDNAGGSVQIKWVLSFTGKEKRLVLNATNAKLISAMHGDEMENWIGKYIKLYPTTTTMNGSVVPCIRVREEIQEATTDDEIPF